MQQCAVAFYAYAYRRIQMTAPVHAEVVLRRDAAYGDQTKRYRYEFYEC